MGNNTQKEAKRTAARADRTLTETALIALFTAIIAVCAWVQIPFLSAVPFTMQTFGIFAALLFLGGKNGTFSVGLYLLLGAVGAPVFSGFRGGIGALAGVTGGYLTGFLLGALVFWGIEAAAAKRNLVGKAVRIAGLAACLAVCYFFGTCWFSIVHEGALNAANLAAAFTACVVPFIVPDIIKLFLSAILYDRLSKVLSRFHRQ